MLLPFAAVLRACVCSLEPSDGFERLIIAGDFRAQCVLANAGSEHTPLRGVMLFLWPKLSNKPADAENRRRVWDGTRGIAKPVRP